MAIARSAPHRTSSATAWGRRVGRLISVLAAIGAASVVGCDDRAPTQVLFDGRDLAGWSSWLQVSGKDNDPFRVFRAEDRMIHVLGTDLAPGQFEFGYLETEGEYENFRFHFEYKWGTRRFVPWGPDSGVFIGVVGQDAVWPRSLECQVAGTDTGSVYVFDRVTIATTIDPAVPGPTYREGGQPYVAPRIVNPDLARIAHDQSVDSLTDWNAVEVTAAGSDVEITVNSHTTFRGSQMRQPDPDFLDDPARDVPLIRGHIAIQNEGSEVFYRNLEIEYLPVP
jgi:hypothetical protein